MKVITAISKSISIVERTFLVLILSLMVGLAFLQVVLRNTMNIGFLWAEPLLRHSVLWIGFLGASLATQQEKHITIDLIARFLSPRITNGARVATNLFAGIICALLSNAGRTFVASERTMGDVLLTIGSTEFPTWWFQLIIPIGFGLMAFRFLLKAIEHIIAALGDHPTDAHPVNKPATDV